MSLGVTFLHGELKSFETQASGPSGDRVQLREAQVCDSLDLSFILCFEFDLYEAG